MTYRLSRALLAMTAVYLLSACSTVSFPQPVGTHVSDEDMVNRFAGAWSTGPSEQVLFVQPLEDGNIAIGRMLWNSDAQRFDTEQMSGVMSELDGVYYINVQDPDDNKDANSYYVVRVSVGSNTNSLVVYSMNYNTFKEAVKSGSLTGKASGNSNGKVTLQGSKKEIDAFLKKTLSGKQLELDEPIIMNLVGEVDD